MEEKIYSAATAAQRLGVSPMQMTRMIKEGRVRVQNIGTSKRPIYAILERDVESLL